MKAPNKKPVMKLSGADKEYIEKYKKEAMGGDYDTLLTTSMKYAEFQ